MTRDRSFALVYSPQGEPLAVHRDRHGAPPHDPYRAQGWNYLLGGGAVYSHLDFSFTVGHEDGSATPAFVAP